MADVRLIDYHEAAGEGLPHYARVLTERGYVYGQHGGPHDIEVRELGAGLTRRQTAKALGIDFQVTPKIQLEDGIHAARLLLPRCWFDAEKTQVGREALQHYRRDYNTRLKEFTATPVHDWASHGADTRLPGLGGAVHAATAGAPAAAGAVCGAGPARPRCGEADVDALKALAQRRRARRRS